MPQQPNHELVITKVLDAPLEQVWQAWTDPKKLQAWWGPRGVTNPVCTWEAQVGGQINIVMLAGKELGDMQGAEWPMTGQFVDVVPQKKLVFSSRPMADGQPIMDTLCSVTFEAQDDKTTMTLTVTVSHVTPAAEAPLAGMEMGWNQSIDKLAESLT